MKIKRTIASFLLLTFCTMFTTPLGSVATANVEEESLYDFIKNINVQMAFSTNG